MRVNARWQIWTVAYNDDNDKSLYVSFLKVTKL